MTEMRLAISSVPDQANNSDEDKQPQRGKQHSVKPREANGGQQPKQYGRKTADRRDDGAKDTDL